MDLKALSIETTLFNIKFQHTIKLMSYDHNSIVIVTKYNEIYCLKQNIDIKEYYFEKINFTSSFKITHLACYNNSIILINENNELFLMGCFASFKENDFKLLNRMDRLKHIKIKYLRLGYNFLFILTHDNTLYGFGDNYNGLGINEEDNDTEENNEMTENDDWIEIPYKAKDISCSESNSILLDLNENIYTTGYNTYGQLGLGDKEDRKKFTKVNLNFKVIKIFADNEASFIVNENNELFGCGYNEEGQLGIGTYKNVDVFTKINFNNCDTKTFYYSNCNSTLITDENNNIYVTGEDRITLAHLHLDKLKKFEKLNIVDCKRKYIYLAIMSKTILFFLSDYKINNYEEEENKLGLKCFSKMSQNQLIDLNVYCKDTILKKRKRKY